MRTTGILERAKGGRLNNQICHLDTSAWLKDRKSIRMEGRFSPALIPGWLGTTGPRGSCRCFSPRPSPPRPASQGASWVPLDTCGCSQITMLVPACRAFHRLVSWLWHSSSLPLLIWLIDLSLTCWIMSPFRVTTLGTLPRVRLRAVPPWAALTLPGTYPTGPWLSVGLADFQSPVKPGTVICHNMPGLGRQWAFNKHLLSF